MRIIKETGRVVSLMSAAVVVLSDLDLEELGNHWLLMMVKNQKACWNQNNTPVVFQLANSKIL
jgi:hypothetical protein